MILHAAARITSGARRRRLRIRATWPWAADIVTAWQRISALAHAPLTRRRACPIPTSLRHQGTVEPRPPGPTAGPLSRPGPTIKITKARSRRGRNQLSARVNDPG
jgi:hypothetical protein